MTPERNGPFDEEPDDDAPDRGDQRSSSGKRDSDAHKRLSINQTTKLLSTIENEVSKAILGKSSVIRMVLAGVLSNGNILFEDFPGLAKTLLSNSLSEALGCQFKRVQFTPDLLPADITGSYFFDPAENQFRFRDGPIFTNILLADEINRAPPKTQAALLRPCRRSRSPSRAPPTTCPNPSSSWPPRTPSSTRAPTPCPRPRWTAS